MTGSFHTRIRASLADANLQSALDANAQKRVQVRQLAFVSLENPQEARARAHRVRADVIANLEPYLNQFIKQARKNGIQVHYAATSAEARKTVMEIALQKGARLIAKSKTMVSEEIGLNHALEKEGFQVVETDLGEYIVQLRGETPSHIITPAVHLRRQDVGELFEEKLGLPYTEDISLMTDAARKKLRQVFLNADIGISGVNFGVAESGTLCVVTNEGNGRMVTTLPQTHIALMGIERLVPSLDDLALMLSLLPRSATGQKLSVYTSLLHGPRKDGDPDGPQERHLILVDNGRKEIQKSGLREILYCIRCGACLNVCPVFREIGGHAYVGIGGEYSPYPGPMGSIISPALFGQAEFGQLARASSLCGACREACPVDIDLPGLLLKVRAGVEGKRTGTKSRPNPPAILALGLDLFTYAASSTKRFGLAQKLVGMFGWLTTMLKKGDPWIRLPALTGWGYSKDFPRPAMKPFHARYNQQIISRNEETKDRAADSDTGIIPAKPDLETLDAQSLLSKFETELVALEGKFILCDENDVTTRILDILRVRSVDEILTWEAAQIPGEVLEKLSAAGVNIRHPNTETIRGYSHIRAGITGVTAAIADTGTILLVVGPGQSLSASLLPEIHIAIIREDNIVAKLSPVLGREEFNRSSAAVLITGPSRTADIEMTLTIGVHGPGELFVICIKKERVDFQYR